MNTYRVTIFTIALPRRQCIFAIALPRRQCIILKISKTNGWCVCHVCNSARTHTHTHTPNNTQYYRTQCNHHLPEEHAPALPAASGAAAAPTTDAAAASTRTASTGRWQMFAINRSLDFPDNRLTDEEAKGLADLKNYLKAHPLKVILNHNHPPSFAPTLSLTHAHSHHHPPLTITLAPVLTPPTYPP